MMYIFCIFLQTEAVFFSFHCKVLTVNCTNCFTDALRCDVQVININVEITKAKYIVHIYRYICLNNDS